jgi:hypothetical protein
MKWNHFDETTGMYTHSTYSETQPPFSTEDELGNIPVHLAKRENNAWIRIEIESLEEKKQRYFDEIYRRKSLLDLSILRRALGKEDVIYNGLQKTDFESLKNNYFHKNEVAVAYLSSGTIINQSLFDLMNNIECEIDFEGSKLDSEVLMLNTQLIPFLGALTGQTINLIPTENTTRIQKYMHIVNIKYIYGSFIFDFLNDFSEVFRSLSITRLDLNQFEKIDAGFELLIDLGAKSIPEIIPLKTMFINL